MDTPLAGLVRPLTWRDFARTAPWPVVGLGVAAALLFALSFFLTWWSFWLYAPQYPDGLRLMIGLHGMSGDVKEIDLLNHYIGMKHLADAAPFERHYAAWGVATVSGLAVALLAAPFPKVNRLAILPALALPLGFVADSYYWLYRYGHHLDAHAPLRIPSFTPQLFGNGRIGQFETFAQPGLGFWVAVAGAVCVIAAVVLRTRLKEAR